MIGKPETYAATRAEDVDFARILDGLEERFGDRNWTVENQRVGTMLLRMFYANLEPEQRDEVIAHIARVQSLSAQAMRLLTPLMGKVTLFVFKDEAYPAKFVSVLEAMARKNIENIQEGGSVFAVGDVVIGEFQGIEADVSRKVSFTLTPHGGKGSPQLIVRIARGALLVEIFTANVPLGPDAIAQLAEEVFRRHRQATQEAMPPALLVPALPPAPPPAPVP
jgi:hypothetical protein